MCIQTRDEEVLWSQTDKKSVTNDHEKWGNSLPVRIPTHIAEKLHLEQGSQIELLVEDQELKLVPTKKKPTLEERLSQITEENRHNELDVGVKGNERL
ncbi:AbrB/MazE/SpoVT family DNA-binding domain-containing protein [Melghirimyces algeriensis]|uniref:Antitoxin MazE n=1 Tax=Melghirimyces algeriensis TaxID=910412 RepID=A0A521E8Q7_9BACL|nr:AbrB/MazE/SpoVT family DNA-binding domain-containing protein [Melghirimyces algeriensis]SMO80328.1 antitoxin MazE [Melghirimyces algeriensis]